jgi:hypothetical protein
VIGNLLIIELHGWMPQGTVFCYSAGNPFSPHAERLGL